MLRLPAIALAEDSEFAQMIWCRRRLVPFVNPVTSKSIIGCLHNWSWWRRNVAAASG